MRSLLAAVVVTLLVACGSPEGQVLSGESAPRASGSLPPARSLPPDDPSLKGCMADWIEGFRSLPPLIDRADLIVRARTMSSTTTNERWGIGYRTSLRVEAVLKGNRPSTVTVLESACPVVYGGPEEWLLFLAPNLDDTNVFQIPGGVQGAFPIRAGRIAPVYSDAYLVRTYTGVDSRELEREISAIRPIDGDAQDRLRAGGWNVAGKWLVSGFELPPASDFGETKIPPRFERPFAGYARISATTGLDLRPFGGKEYEDLEFVVERIPPTSEIGRIAHMIYIDRTFVGGWIQVGAEQVFRLDDRARALAASPRPFAMPSPPSNRYPRGVNVVAEYGLAAAQSAYVKPLISRTVTPPPPPPVRDLVGVLDRTYPTESPPPRATEGYWVVGFQVGEHYVIFEFYPDTGLLVQRDDGYAIRPDTGFARLVGASR